MSRACALLVLAAACGAEAASEPADETAYDVDASPAPPADAALVATPVAKPLDEPPPWTFAVLSDLHLPNVKDAHVAEIVDALIAAHVRFVVITGDHTNGNAADHKRTFVGEGWSAVRTALAPLRAAHIPVLPVAGNHDTYEPWQRDEYEQAFRDLEGWAAPLTINPQRSDGVHAQAPFSYSVDVDNVHLSLVHLVAQSVEPDVARWLDADLAAAGDATHRIVFGHVPMSSVMRPPRASYVRQLGTLLARGHATMLVAGHEHLVWDENVLLPDGGSVRQVLVGCASGVYVYGPSALERERASCDPISPRSRQRLQCRMPNGGGAFELTLRRKNSYIEHARTAFTLFTVDGASIDVRPMTLGPDGYPVPFYLGER